MIKRLSLLLVVFMMTFTSVAYAVERSETNSSLTEEDNTHSESWINSQAVYVGCESEVQPLFQKNPHERMAMASLSKIMTVILTLEKIQAGQIGWEDLVLISEDADAQKGSSFKIEAGTEMTVRELVNETMIASANDAAYALAEYVGGSVEAFVKSMNDKARDIGMVNFQFINPNGLPGAEDSQNEATAEDIYKLAAYAIENYGDILLPITSQVSYTSARRTKKNTNHLLKMDMGFDGLKTGYTDAAGYCLVSTKMMPALEAGGQAYRIIIVTMGAENDTGRIEDHVHIAKYIENDYAEREVISTNQIIKTIQVNDLEGYSMNLVPKESVTRLCAPDLKQVKLHAFVNRDIALPITAGQEMGFAVILFSDGSVERVTLVSETAISTSKKELK